MINSLDKFQTFISKNPKVVAYFGAMKCTACHQVAMEFASLAQKYARHPIKYDQYKLVVIGVLEDRRFFAKIKFLDSVPTIIFYYHQVPQ